VSFDCPTGPSTAMTHFHIIRACRQDNENGQRSVRRRWPFQATTISPASPSQARGAWAFPSTPLGDQNKWSPLRPCAVGLSLRQAQDAKGLPLAGRSHGSEKQLFYCGYSTPTCRERQMERQTAHGGISPMCAVALTSNCDVIALTSSAVVRRHNHRPGRNALAVAGLRRQ
jgi:hypothetical protein